MKRSMVVLAAAGLLGACSSASTGPGPMDEDTASTHEALSSDAASFTISPDQFAFLLEAGGVNPSGASPGVAVTFDATKYAIDIAPSQATVDLINKANPNSPPQTIQQLTQVESLTPFSVDAPDPLGAYNVTLTSFTASNILVDMQPSTIHAHAQASVSLHLSSSNVLQPNFDISIPVITGDVYFGLTNNYPAPTGYPVPTTLASPATGGVSSSVSIATPNGYSVSNCGILGMCDGIVSGHIGNVASTLQAQLGAILTKFTQTAVPYQDFISFVTGYYQSTSQIAKGSQLLAWPTLANSTLSLQFLQAPATPPACTTTSACYASGAGMVEVNCPAATDPLSLQWEYSAGNWIAAESPNGWPMAQEAAPGGSYTLRVCETNLVGTTCGAPFVATASTYTCPTTTGGGVYGGGAPPKPCGGHICYQ